MFDEASKTHLDPLVCPCRLSLSVAGCKTSITVQDSPSRVFPEIDNQTDHKKMICIIIIYKLVAGLGL